MQTKFEEKFDVSYEVYRVKGDEYIPVYACDELEQLSGFMNSVPLGKNIQIGLVYNSFSKERDSEIAYVADTLEEMIEEVHHLSEMLIDAEVDERFIH